MKKWFSQAIGPTVYGVVLFVIVFSTLEQFSEVNADFGVLGRPLFHAVMFVLAFVVATYEAVTLRGLSGLRNLFERPEPIEVAPAGTYMYRRAHQRDLKPIRDLAKERYGYSFTAKELERWHGCNPACLFLMFCDGELVGYVDAFPISKSDYEHLLQGGREQDITPLKPARVGEESSFYIASLVIAEGFGSKLLSLITEAVRFYGRTYQSKPWTRLCARGHSERGRELLTERGMALADQEQAKQNLDKEKQMFQIDDRTPLSRSNYRFWKRLFPRAMAPPPSGKTSAELTARSQARRLEQRRIRRGLA